jgi:hypothetical protein
VPALLLPAYGQSIPAVERHVRSETRADDLARLLHRVRGNARVDSDSATTRSPLSKAIVHFSSFVPAEHSRQLDLLPPLGDACKLHRRSRRTRPLCARRSDRPEAEEHGTRCSCRSGCGRPPELVPARLSKLVTPPRPKCSCLAIATRSSEVALHVAGQARAPGPCEPCRGTVGASLLSIGETDRLRTKASLW